VCLITRTTVHVPYNSCFFLAGAPLGPCCLVVLEIKSFLEDLVICDLVVHFVWVVVFCEAGAVWRGPDVLFVCAVPWLCFGDPDLLVPATFCPFET
jgi:hypothetical protein